MRIVLNEDVATSYHLGRGFHENKLIKKGWEGEKCYVTVPTELF